ncbi:MAG: magnesium/cobalt transporter CorA [Planctomycetes bacterium]|nr:magnesium/cobalt transporter CorA [Planctomycetota bacterium]
MSDQSRRRVHRSLRHHFRRKTKPGDRPGTIVVDPEAPKPQITVIAYTETDLVDCRVEQPSELAALLEKWPVVWVNVDGLGDADTLNRIAEIFKLHRLTLEDVCNVHQRPKIEPYEEHAFVVVRMPHNTEGISTEQVSLLIGRNYVLTFQEFEGDVFDMVRQRIREGRPVMRKSGPSYLAYALIDTLIDSYFPILEQIGDRIETLEAAVLDNPDESVVSEIHAVKSDLLVLRRAVWPMREMISGMTRDQSPYIEQSTHVYLRDCYDHTVQLIDTLDTFRELAGGLLDIYLSSVSNRMNEVMKVLTIFAAIFIPLTFMAGVYGMNFENMPELKMPWAYPALLLSMAVVGFGMLAFFASRGWVSFGSRKRPPTD